MSNLVRVDVSKKKVILEDTVNCEFEVTVTNLSNKFASFEIELETQFDASHSNINEHNSTVKWYSVEPEICSKLQPGDKTCFRVVIVKAPIPAYDTTIDLAIKVFSVEYEHLSNSANILLEIKQPNEPLKIHLPYPDIKAYPGDDVDIPVVVTNFSSYFQEVYVILQLDNVDWYNKSVIENVSLTSGESKQTILQLKLPNQIKTTPTFSYFTVSVKYKLQDNDSVSTGGTIEILPYGEVLFEFPVTKQKITSSFTKLFRVFNKNNNSLVKYSVKFQNQSNLEQLISFDFLDNHNQPLKYQPIVKQNIILEPGLSNNANTNITKIVEEKITITQHQHRWGGIRRLFIKVIPAIVNPKTGEVSKQIQAKPNTQILELEIYPIISIWLILGCGLLGVLLFWLLFPRQNLHEAPVYSVRLIGNANTVISGSSDTKIRRWQVNSCNWLRPDCFLENEGDITNTQNTKPSEISKQPIRVVREIPAHEGQIAAGLEDGTIQFWQVSPAKPIGSKIENTNDRVFDLDFTKDSKYLFSGHGSGNLRQWDVEKVLTGQPGTNVKDVPFGAAISTLSVIEKLDSSFLNNRNNDTSKLAEVIKGIKNNKTTPVRGTDILEITYTDNDTNSYLIAVAGQYNKLAFFNSSTKIPYQVNYKYIATNKIQPVFSANDYINTVSVSDSILPERLATGDNKGFITLWDLSKIRECVKNNTKQCGDIILQQWRHSEEAESVYSVSISDKDKACYLASAGSDGRVVLWGMNNKPKQLQEYLPSGADSKKSRSVDIKITSDKNSQTRVVLISAAQGNQVSVYRYQEQENDCK